MPQGGCRTGRCCPCRGHRGIPMPFPERTATKPNFYLYFSLHKVILKEKEGDDSPMTSNGSKFKIEDLYIGMEISDKNQLSNIYDTWILLVKGKNDDVYTVQFIGRETNAESDKLFAQGNVVCPVYNDSLELEGDIYYEE